MDAFDDDAPVTSRRTTVRRAGELVISTGTVLGVVGSALVGVATPAGAVPVDHQVTSALDDDGAGLTLREAIAQAVAGDSISFNLPPGTVISLSQGDLPVDKALTITGPGSEQLTIDAGEGDRAFYLYSDVGAPVTISGLTVTGGDVEGDGGGILARLIDLSLDDVVLDGNTAGGNGGGLAVHGGSLDMVDSTASGNDGNFFGGGVSVQPYFGEGTSNPTGVAIQGSTLSGNTANSGGGASVLGVYGESGVSISDSVVTGNQAVNQVETGKYLGAGLLVGRNFGVEVVDTTISGNTSAGGGGGIAQFDYAGGGPILPPASGGPSIAAASPGLLRVERTTISANTAQGNGGNGPGGGGGLWVGFGSTHVQLLNSTVSGNTAPNGEGGGIYAPFGDFENKYVSIDHSTVVGNSAVVGGGVFGDVEETNQEQFTIQSVEDPDFFSSHVSAYHSIIGNNTATETGPDVGGGLEARWSLVENTSGGVVVDQGNNLFDQDPQLGSLVDNDGPTLTHLPHAGSPVVNVGDPSIEVAPETDQRGLDRILDGRIDIGAVEGSGRSSLPVGPVGPCAGAPPGVFVDVTSANVHHAAVDCLAFLGITEGGPQGLPDDQYGPALNVTRAQMAGFLARLVTKAGVALPTDAPDAFSDDDGTTHEAAINALAAAGVVEGFGDGTFHPGAPVRRDQMASFLLRTHDFISPVSLAVGEDAFDDDEPGNVHEAAINALFAVGVIEGTATPRMYDPSSSIRRDQMASFLIRLAQLLSSEGEFPTF